MHLYCPFCSGRMQRYVGNIMVQCGLFEVARHRVGEYIVCTMCSVSSEVDTHTGTLVDLGQVTLEDLTVPTEEALTFVVAAPARLDGRSES